MTQIGFVPDRTGIKRLEGRYQSVTKVIHKVGPMPPAVRQKTADEASARIGPAVTPIKNARLNRTTPLMLHAILSVAVSTHYQRVKNRLKLEANANKTTKINAPYNTLY